MGKLLSEESLLFRTLLSDFIEAFMGVLLRKEGGAGTNTRAHVPVLLRA